VPPGVVPGELTEVTELSTALGLLGGDLDGHLGAPAPPAELCNVDDATWERLRAVWQRGNRRQDFHAGFRNGEVFTASADGLRGRPPARVEWRGPTREPGDGAIPADLRVDRVYLLSCKYLSKVLVNAGPARLFDRLLTGGQRGTLNWFGVTAPAEFQAFYDAAVAHTGLDGLPEKVDALERADQQRLKEALSARTLPDALVPAWAELSKAVADASAQRWAEALSSARERQWMLWRLLRIGPVAYFVLGTQRPRGRQAASALRVRVDSAWDWSQSWRLADFRVAARTAGQPEVGWQAVVTNRAGDGELEVAGHVEVRWSHGRFLGLPEAKVYLDTPHTRVPGYSPLG